MVWQQWVVCSFLAVCFAAAVDEADKYAGPLVILAILIGLVASI